MEKLFRRDGTEFDGKVERDAKGRAGYWTFSPCMRCGGAGGSNAWPGWRCFRCGGRGSQRFESSFSRVYTEKELARVNKSAATRERKKAEKHEIAAGVAEVERTERVAELTETHAALIERAKVVAPLNAFVADVLQKGLERGTWSDKQIEALTNAVARAERDAANATTSKFYAAKEGTRVTADVEVVRIGKFKRAAWNRYRGDENGEETVHVVTMRDAHGHCFVSMGTHFSATEGDKFTMSATIKDFKEYQGMKQTMVNRVKML